MITIGETEEGQDDVPAKINTTKGKAESDSLSDVKKVARRSWLKSDTGPEFDTAHEIKGRDMVGMCLAHELEQFGKTAVGLSYRRYYLRGSLINL